MINSGARVEVMESLADLMAHSPQIQQKIYSRYDQTLKSTLALDALAAISSKVLEPGNFSIFTRIHARSLMPELYTLLDARDCGKSSYWGWS